MLVSISEGDCRDGLFGAILFKAADDIVVGEGVEKRRRGTKYFAIIENWIHGVWGPSVPRDSA